MTEVRVIYKDNGMTRALRGVQILHDDPDFIKLIRSDGSVVQFARNCVERIVEEGASNGHR